MKKIINKNIFIALSFLFIFLFNINDVHADPSDEYTCDVNIYVAKKNGSEKTDSSAKLTISGNQVIINEWEGDYSDSYTTVSNTINPTSMIENNCSDVLILCTSQNALSDTLTCELINKVDLKSIKYDTQSSTNVTPITAKVKTNKKNVSCGEIDKEVNEYYSYKEVLDTGICSQLDNYDSVETCKQTKLNRNIIITNLMKLKEQNALCDSNKSDVDKIISENEDICGKVFSDDLNNIVNTIMKIFYIIGPIILIIFTSVDYTKAIVSYEKDVMKKTNQRFIKRIIATIFLFFSPLLTNVIIGFSVGDYALSGNSYSCEFEYIQYNKTYQIKTISNPNTKFQNSSSTSVDVISTGGITTDEEMNELTEVLNNMLNTKIHYGDYSYQNGPFPEYWTSPINQLQAFQCTWWANGRASQYLASHGTVYNQYPTQMGHGGQYYDVNKENGYFNYGQTPKPNSIISWKVSGSYGHVAYVEGVSNDGIYISHAGSGKSWRGVEKIPLSGDIGWSGYVLNGYIYLDEPIQK